MFQKNTQTGWLAFIAFIAFFMAFIAFIAFGAIAGLEAGVNRRQFDRGKLQGGLKKATKHANAYSNIACILHAGYI